MRKLESKLMAGFILCQIASLWYYGTRVVLWTGFGARESEPYVDISELRWMTHNHTQAPMHHDHDCSCVVLPGIYLRGYLVVSLVSLLLLVVFFYQAQDFCIFFVMNLFCQVMWMTSHVGLSCMCQKLAYFFYDHFFSFLVVVHPSSKGGVFETVFAAFFLLNIVIKESGLIKESC